MPRYIDAEQAEKMLGNAYQETMIASLQPENKIQKFVATGLNFAKNIIHDDVPTADVREVGKTQWHLVDIYDEETAPTEAGKYLVIDENGNEYVDYFFATPRMTVHGVSYWKDSYFPIRAWIRLDGKDGDENEADINP